MTESVLSFGPTDQKERERAVDPARSVVVQAPAGSGKTTLLTERFLRLLPTVEEPEQILAITFTRAAVAEMRSRIVGALQGAQDGKIAKDAGEQRLLDAARAALACSHERGWGLLEEPQQLNVQTIDGLALRIAQQTPLTSRLGPGFAPTEDAQGYYKGAALQAMQALEDLESSDPLARQTAEAAATLLRHRDNHLQPCAELLADMLASRDQWGRVFPLQSETLSDKYLDDDLRPKLEGHLRSAVEHHLRGLRMLLQQRDGLWRRLLPLVQFAARTAENETAHCKDLLGLPEHRAECLNQWVGIAAMLFTGSGTARKNLNRVQGFLPGGVSDAEKKLTLAIAQDICEDEELREALLDLRMLPPTSYSDQEWHVAKALFRLLLRGVVELQLSFASNGLVDFTEVGLAAVSALQADLPTDYSHPSELASALSGHYRHLLVDEFQDTSITQYKLLTLLLQGWEQGEGRTLFCVGDPMQSIYLFRQAELKLFHHVREHGIADVPVEQATLSVNFRSQPLLVDQHNAMFHHVFAGQKDVAFVESRPFARPPHEPPMTWHFFRKTERDSDNKTAPAEDEACTALQLVREALDVGDEKVAILVRAKAHAARIMQRLRESSIPYRAIDMEPLSGRQEVLDVHALTRALLNPADRVAWLSILRGPWCGLSLASLDLLAGERSHATVADLLATRLDQLPQSDQFRVRWANTVLESAQKLRRDKRLPGLVWDTWRALGGESCLDPEQAANVTAYFAMLETMDREGRSLRADTIESAIDSLCAMPNPDPAARVEVLTIHKAKGREFDTVIVPQMHRCAARDRNVALHWMEDSVLEDPAEAPWYLAPIAATGGDSSDLAEWIKGKKKARQHAEVRRLFYVAATRAKRQLHLMATVGVKEQELKRPSAGTLLDVAWCVAKDEAEAQLLGIPCDDPSGLAMAAAEAPRIHRLPDAWFAAAANATPEELVSSQVKRTGTGQEQIPKPASILASAETRIGGTALHALLERAAHLRAGGESWETIKAWAGNVARGLSTLLVLEGMPASKADKAAQNIVFLLQNAVNQEAGRWVLEHRPGALTEYSLTHCENDRAEDLRLDRVFPAGPALLSHGDSDLWIVDYKSASLQGPDVAGFLALQQAAYAEQMSRYAHALRFATQDARPIHCALYFPALDTLHVVAELP